MTARRPPRRRRPSPRRCGRTSRRAAHRGRAARRRAGDVRALRVIRDWLDDLGVDRVTLLVIPAPRLHPFPARSPELANWLLDRRDGGRRDRPARAPAPADAARAAPHAPGPALAGRPAAEYPGLDADAAAESVEAGRRRARAPGCTPHGFVAPGYAYTPALRRAQRPLRLVGDAAHAPRGATPRAPALCLGTGGPLKRATSRPDARRRGAVAAAAAAGPAPRGLRPPGHVRAVERVLQRAGSAQR